MRNQLAIFLNLEYDTCMPYYDEIFKHVTREFPSSLAALALKTSEVEVGEPLNTGMEMRNGGAGGFSIM